MAALSPESLLAGLAAGDESAADAFIATFEARVYGLTSSILRDRVAAEEAAQETFVRAWRHAATFDPRRGSVAGWLLTIARNVSIDMLPRRAVPADPVELARMLDATPSPADGAQDAPVSDEVRAALEDLPVEQRRPLVLAVFYGFPMREIARIENVPVGTVKSRVRAALTKLRSRMEVGDAW
ncbi:MAG TPA: sigma-70 family RNA polymerase sigma factor [Actinomycetota bacterium]|nr:sigma-70 family RNA polymerase sigma factor [Actinomycetota bacterium]